MRVEDTRKDKRPQTLQTALRAGQVLTLFSEREPELSVARVAGLLSVPPSTAYRLLASLQEASLVEQNPETKRYRLSWMMFTLGNSVLNRIGLGGRADSAMRSLADVSGETVNLGVRSGGALIYLRKIESPEMLRADTHIGSRVPLHCTALGKVLLAFLSPSERTIEIRSLSLRRWTEHTITDPDRLEEELQCVRACGVAIDNEEFQSGVRGMACPIRDRRGQVIAGLSIGAPVSRLTDARIRELECPLREQADGVSRSLGCPEECLSLHPA